MQSRKLSLAAVVVAVALCLAGWTVYAQKRAPQRVIWEYKAATLSTVYAQDKPLNELGAQGWELVGVTEVGGGTVYFFKRPK